MVKNDGFAAARGVTGLMSREIEIKLLGINADTIRTFLSNKGASFDAIYNFKRVVFDTTPINPDAWIRLRSDGTTTTLTYKHIHSDAIDGTEEIEVVVNSFEETKKLLEKSGLVSRNYQENTREQYFWNDCQITIDTWPQLAPYVEIEASHEELVRSCLDLFDGLYERTTTESTDTLYANQGINLHDIKELTFDKAL